jgi:AcrR family transcriptional regulator
MGSTAAAGVSGSQMYHYFPDKDELVQAVISYQAGQFPDGTDPDALAVTLLATLQGGLLLAQVQRDSRPLETAVDTLLQLARSG